MKTSLFTFLAFLFFITSASAQRNNNIVIFCNDGDRFTLIMDGLKYNETPDVRVKATGLNLDKYQVKLIFENKKIKDLNTYIDITGTGAEFVFGLYKKNKKEYAIDRNAIVSQLEPKAVEEEKEDTNNDTNTNTNTTTNNNTTNTNTTTNTNSTTPTTTNNNNTNSMSVKVAGMNIGMNQNGGIKLGTKTGDINLNTKDKSGTVVIDDGTNNGIVLNKVAKTGCAAAMSSTQFATIKKSISSQASDSTKLMAANTVADNNCFSVSQVKEIMQLFSDDKSKLEFAKYAYPHTNDLSNYYQLKEPLSKDESKKDLQKFIHEQK